MTLVIAQNYLNCVSECGIIPRRLRADCGTENGTIAAIHCSLRSSHTDNYARAASHLYGSSTANQRIESWWSCFCKQRCHNYIYIYFALQGRNTLKQTIEHCDPCMFIAF